MSRGTYALLVLLIEFLCATLATADTAVYGWIDHDGTASFTDDAARVPRGVQPETRIVTPLSDYERFTRDDYAFVPEKRELPQVAERLQPEKSPIVDNPRPERRRKRHRSERNERGRVERSERGGGV